MRGGCGRAGIGQARDRPWPQTADRGERSSCSRSKDGSRPRTATARWSCPNVSHQPRAITSAQMSGTPSRDSGIPSVAGNSQASALTATTTLRGERLAAGRCEVVPLAQPGLARRNAYAISRRPRGGCPAGSELVVVHPTSGQQHHLGSHDVPVGQRIAAGALFQLLRSASLNSMRYGLLRA
jgi:hypothetical protein